MIDANSQFFAILTNVGMAKQANADALGIPWLITQMGVGDANPSGLADPPNPVPSASQTKLLNEWRRKPLNQLKIDPVNPAVIIAEQIIPADEGGKWIREIGLYDADGDLVAVANCAPSFKPLLSQGSGRTQIVRMNFIVTSTGNIQLKIDPAIVLASRAYVDAAILEVLPKNKAAGQYTRVKVNDRGVFVSGDNPETLAGMGIKDTYTKTEIEAMIAQASALPVGATVAFPLNKVAPGFLELDGSVKSAAVYPDLAAFLGTAFNKGDEGAGNFRLPESRGEFLRGWDHGRGIDAGRLVGSYQDQAVIDHFHTVLTADAGPLPNPVAGNLVGSANANLAPISRPAGAGVLGATLTSNVFGPAAAKGGMETRPRNLAVVWCIKAWNAPINQGNIDIAALAALVESFSDNGPVVGSMRGDRMQVTAASSVATFKVDEVIVGNANGKTRTVRNLSQVIDLASATKGLGAMDVGAPPANGYVALYAFFNADSNAMGVMAFNCTSVVAPVVYGGAAPPAGYSFSALVGVWPTNASGQFQVGLWEDQTFYLVNKQVLSTSGGRADFTPFTAAAAVPMNAKKCQGHVVLQNNLTNANTYAALGGVGGVGAQFFASNPAAAANGGYQSAFPFIPLTTPQTLYHILSASIGVATFLVNITAYKI